MGTVRKKIKVKRESLTGEHSKFLLDGHAYIISLIRPFIRRDGSKNMGAIAAAWETLRDELLPAYIANHPGQRPWAWWQCGDAPEKLRRLITGYDAEADPISVPATRNYHYGRYWSYGWEEFSDPPIVETQAAYLERHGLLSEAEREALGPDFPREEAYCLKELSGPMLLPEYRGACWPPHRNRNGTITPALCGQ